MTDELLITPQEVEFVLKNSKETKAISPDQFPVELIKLIEEDQIPK